VLEETGQFFLQNFFHDHAGRSTYEVAQMLVKFLLVKQVGGRANGGCWTDILVIIPMVLQMRGTIVLQRVVAA